MNALLRGTPFECRGSVVGVPMHDLHTRSVAAPASRHHSRNLIPHLPFVCLVSSVGDEPDIVRVDTVETRCHAKALSRVSRSSDHVHSIGDRSFKRTG